MGCGRGWGVEKFCVIVPDRSDVEEAVAASARSRRMLFDRYIGIDYSGAQTPVASLKGLRVCRADRAGLPIEVLPPPGGRAHWSRRGIAAWLIETLSETGATLVGIDHGFSFPLAYFAQHRLAHDWPAFLDDFHRHWPTDRDDVSVESVRKGMHGDGAARGGNTRWRRLTERRAGAAKSVFHFDVPGSVAKSTHAGLPWLRAIRETLGERVQFWPFDGWERQPGRSTIAEIYPSLWSRGFPRDDRTPDQHDAYAVAAWLQRADRDGQLAAFFSPTLTPEERRVAEIEGWILGVM